MLNNVIGFLSRERTRPDISSSATQRYTERQLAHFIDFIQSSHVITDMAFGKCTIKVSSGQKFAVPAVVRNIIPSRIIAQ